jgi:membrane associated rhomboid family serine protease
MRSAAVGFQCPECVSQGARSTRVGRAPYGGARSSNPALTSQVLIALNLAVYVLLLATGGGRSPWFYRLALLPAHAVAPDGHGGAVLVPGVADGAYWQLFTSMFVHTAIWHIGFNMVALWVLGPQLEGVLGRVRFLTVYLVSGLAGSAMIYWFSPTYEPTIGASTALFGLMGALLVVVIRVRGQVNQVLMWIGLNFVFTVLGRGFISWQGHLGGFIGGVLVAAILVYAPRGHRVLWQVLGVGLVVVGLAVAVLTRTATLT